MPLHRIHEDLRGGRGRPERRGGAMRAHLADFPVVSPARLEDALAEMSRGASRPGGVTPLAGATDLYVLLSAGQLKPTTFLDLGGVRELASAPAWDGERFSFGAATTYTEVRRAARVDERLPL